MVIHQLFVGTLMASFLYGSIATRHISTTRTLFFAFQRPDFLRFTSIGLRICGYSSSCSAGDAATYSVKFGGQSCQVCMFAWLQVHLFTYSSACGCL